MPMNEHAGLFTILILLIAAIVSMPNKIGSMFLFERKPPRAHKTRAQHEAELAEMLKEYDPPTAAERRQWAQEENEAYIEHAAAHTMRTSWYDGFDNLHWEEYVIDRFQNRVVIHSSDKTGRND